MFPDLAFANFCFVACRCIIWDIVRTFLPDNISTCGQCCRTNSLAKVGAKLWSKSCSCQLHFALNDNNKEKRDKRLEEKFLKAPHGDAWSGRWKLLLLRLNILMFLYLYLSLYFNLCWLESLFTFNGRVHTMTWTGVLLLLSESRSDAKQKHHIFHQVIKLTWWKQNIVSSTLHLPYFVFCEPFLDLTWIPFF